MQTSVAARANHKLSFRYFGPYEVESKVGAVAYKLKLPPTSSVHTVFHVSLLKKAVGMTHTDAATLPSSKISLQVPELVLDCRLKTKNKRVVPQLLIKWAGCPAEMASWEDEDRIQSILKATTACGQAVIQGGGDVTTTAAAASSASSSERPKRASRPSTRVFGPEWARQ